MEETRSRARPRWHAMLAFGLAAVTISATTSYCWNRVSGSGSHAAAKRIAWEGDDSERSQAIYRLFQATRHGIEELQTIAHSGNGVDAQQAEQALTHLRRSLR